LLKETDGGVRRGLLLVNINSSGLNSEETQFVRMKCVVEIINGVLRRRLGPQVEETGSEKNNVILEITRAVDCKELCQANSLDRQRWSALLRPEGIKYFE
jgi:hypothetical protein